jgi:hypothetical protein
VVRETRPYICWSSLIEGDMEINFRKTPQLVELGEVDISNVKQDILSIPESDWDDEDSQKANQQNKMGVLQETRHIIFKFSVKRKDPIEYFDLPAWAKWKDRLLPLMEEATKSYGYKKAIYPRVMLANLPAGAKIEPHTDGAVIFTRPHKIHIPIQTNPDVLFYQYPEKHHLMEGHAYEVNNAGLHAVENNGKTDRIHLIFEYLEIV